eukprot:g8434.t1
MSDIPVSKRAAGGDLDSDASCTPDASDGSSSSSSPPSKRPRTNEEAVSPGAGGAEDQAPAPPPATWRGPRTIVTFNVNGGIPRMTKDWREIDAFVTNEGPDLIVFQEIRLPAKGPPKCKPTENAGRKRGQMKDDTKKDRDDIALVDRTLRALARKLGYRVVMSLANSKKAGSAALIKNDCPAEELYFSFDPSKEGGLSKEHDTEGRVMVLKYPSVTVVALYVPNNGVKEESFRRRREWDAALRRFVTSFSTGPLIVCGDLNVSYEDSDLTHPTFFKNMFPSGSSRNSGQPGCTPAERERHSDLLASGDGLVDAYRHLHPATSAGTGTDTPGITWRGTAGNVVPEAGRYYGKGMRIDYFLVSKELVPRVKEVKVFGSGADRKGFLGSDHCPLKITLLDSEDQ